MTTHAGPSAREADHDREGADPAQQLTDMLQELRVVQTGVQILSAFLLTLPFTNKWDQLLAGQRVVYAVSVVAAAVATALVIGPVSYHRTRFGEVDKSHLVRISSWLARSGLAALLVAAVAAVFLALDVGIGRTVALWLTVPVALLFIGIWYVLPALHGRRGDRARVGHE